MTRLNLLLVLLLIGSSMVLINTAYEARRLVTANAEAEREQRQLDSDLKRLEAERQDKAATLRVEAEASSRLQMRKAPVGVRQYVDDVAAKVAGVTP